MEPLSSDSLLVLINKLLSVSKLHSSPIRSTNHKGIKPQGESSTVHLYLSDANRQLSFTCKNRTFGAKT